MQHPSTLPPHPAAGAHTAKDWNVRSNTHFTAMYSNHYKMSASSKTLLIQIGCSVYNFNISQGKFELL